MADQTDFVPELTRDAKSLLDIGPKDFSTVLKNYDVTSEGAQDMVHHIREWINKQPHLPADKIRDPLILGYLILKGFSMEKVKHTIDDLFTAKHKMPEVLCNRDPLDPEVSRNLSRGYWVVMPKRTPENYRLSMFRANPTHNSVPMVFKLATMFAEYRVWNDASMGDCWIMDLSHASLQDVLQMTPTMISNIFFFVTTAFGARLKSIHIINMPAFAAGIVNIFKRLMKTKLADRVFVSTEEELLNIFPKYCIPEEYGGEGGSADLIADEWCKTLQSSPWRQYFLEQNKVFTDESKRLEPNPSNEIFGENGSFRQLCLD